MGLNGESETETIDDILLLTTPVKHQRRCYPGYPVSSSPPSLTDDSEISEIKSEMKTPEFNYQSPTPVKRGGKPPAAMVMNYHSPVLATPPPRRSTTPEERRRVSRLQDSISRLRRTTSPRPKKRRKTSEWSADHWRRLERLIAPLNLDQDFTTLPNHVYYEFDEFDQKEVASRVLAIVRTKFKSPRKKRAPVV